MSICKYVYIFFIRSGFILYISYNFHFLIFRHVYILTIIFGLSTFLSVFFKKISCSTLMRQLMQEYSVYFSSSFSILSLASGACLFIFSGKPNMDIQAILSPPTFGASGASYFFAKSISLKVRKIPSKSTSPSPMARCWCTVTSAFPLPFSDGGFRM